MKKVVLFILSLLFIPICVNASIKSVEITGEEKVNIYDNMIVSIHVDFDDITNREENKVGIMALKYEIEFDEDIFTINSINSQDFDSSIYKEDDKYYVVSLVNTTLTQSILTKNACSDGYLFCSNYNATLKLYVKNADTSDTMINIKNIETYVIDYSNIQGDYTSDDVSVLNSELSDELKVNISKTKDEDEKDLVSIVKNEKIDIYENVSNIKKSRRSIDGDKSSNANLKELSISGYDISFDSEILEYNIAVGKDVNSITVNATVEDETASYVITGAEDLNSYGNKVSIEVSAEDGTKKIYVINVSRQRIVNEDVSISKKISGIKIDKNFIYIIIGVIVLIIIISRIISKTGNKNIDKYLDEL